MFEEFNFVFGDDFCGSPFEMRLKVPLNEERTRNRSIETN